MVIDINVSIDISPTRTGGWIEITLCGRSKGGKESHPRMGLVD